MRKGHVSEKTDGFALGVVLVELLTALSPTKARDLVDDHTVNTLAEALCSQAQKMEHARKAATPVLAKVKSKKASPNDKKKSMSLAAEMSGMARNAQMSLGLAAPDAGTVALEELASVAVALTLARPRSAPVDVLPALEKAHAALVGSAGAQAQGQARANMDRTSPPVRAPGPGD
jgi:hypothetical protein